MEITTIWFLVVMVGGQSFGSLQHYDSKELCQERLDVVLQHVDKAVCIPQPISPDTKR